MVTISSLDRSPEAIPPPGQSGVVPLVLEGRFVRLQPLTLAHVPALVVAASGPRDSYAWTTVPAEAPAMEAYVQEALSGQAAGRTLPFATVSREAGTVLGTTRFANIEYWHWPPGSPHQRGAHLPDAVEIGWTWLAAAAQRTPINTEAKLLMLRHAFETWHVHRVRLMTDVRNTRSRAAIERIGGQLDGVLRAHTVAADGAIRDSAVYSLLDSEWPALQRRLEARLAS